MKIERLKEAYTKAVELCEEYEDFYKTYDFDGFRSLSEQARRRLTIIEWNEKYGLNIGYIRELSSDAYLKIDEHRSIHKFNDAKRESERGYGKFISWSDDERQPKDEWLLVIGFSTGTYIFGEDYAGQKPLFDEFFNELKTYNPDYSDSHNHYLYWKLENAKPIYDDFQSILSKYIERNKLESKKREIDRLESELKELKEEIK